MFRLRNLLILALVAAALGTIFFLVGRMVRLDIR